MMSWGFSTIAGEKNSAPEQKKTVRKKRMATPLSVMHEAVARIIASLCTGC